MSRHTCAIVWLAGLMGLVQMGTACLAAQEPAVDIRPFLVPVRATGAVTIGDKVLHPAGTLSGIVVGDGTLVLCPSFLQQALVPIPQTPRLGHVAYRAVLGGREVDAQPVYIGPDLMLLKIPAKAPTAALRPDMLKSGPPTGKRVILARAAAEGLRLAYAQPAPALYEEEDSRRLRIPACPLPGDWLGAICLEEDGSGILGLLTDFRPDPTDNPIYCLHLNNVSMAACPDAIVTRMDPRDLQTLVRNYAALELSRLAWMGVRYAFAADAAGSPEVVAVAQQSLAERAGILPGDRIVEANGEPPASGTNGELMLFATAGVDGPVRLKVRREGQVKEYKVDLPEPEASRPWRAEELDCVLERAWPPDGVGFRVRDIGSDGQLQVPGLRIADVIVRIDGQAFKDADHLKQAAEVPARRFRRAGLSRQRAGHSDREKIMNACIRILAITVVLMTTGVTAAAGKTESIGLEEFLPLLEQRDTVSPATPRRYLCELTQQSASEQPVRLLAEVRPEDGVVSLYSYDGLTPGAAATQPATDKADPEEPLFRKTMEFHYGAAGAVLRDAASQIEAHYPNLPLERLLAPTRAWLTALLKAHPSSVTIRKPVSEDAEQTYAITIEDMLMANDLQSGVVRIWVDAKDLVVTHMAFLYRPRVRGQSEPDHRQSIVKMHMKFTWRPAMDTIACKPEADTRYQRLDVLAATVSVNAPPTQGPGRRQSRLRARGRRSG